ncbi:MAG: DNA repair protein RecO [Pseudomonadota bacterium]
MARISNEPTVVLHTRPYRESSQLLDLFTLNYGRVGAVLKGQRSKQRSLPVFARFAASWYGAGALVTLATPQDVQPLWLRGTAAPAGFYVAELLVRLLREREPMPELFAMTLYTLERCADGVDLRAALRPFEWQLLEELGCCPDFSALGAAGTAWYEVQADGSLMPCDPAPAAVVRRPHRHHWSDGERLLVSAAAVEAIAERSFDDVAVAGAARRLFRALIEPLLQGKPLRSRELLSPAVSGLARLPEHHDGRP